jgi:uncharacterized protein (DUF1800 family)
MTRTKSLLALLLVLAATGGAPLAAPARRLPPPDPEEAARAVHLLERATFGPRPADLAEVLRLGRERWLDRQLHPQGIDDSALEARLAPFPVTAMTVAELYERFPPPALAKRAAAAGGDTAMTAPRRAAGAAMGPQRMVAEMGAAKLVRAAYSERQLEEVMTDFWFNHFNVFAGKRPVAWLVSDYERTAIRPHVFGKFEDLLVATATHPAMLLYLDNAQSVAIDSTLVRRLAARAGQPARAARMRGLNENYARELLELHTLGVDAGYTQQDVREVARVLTGWSLGGQVRNDPAGASFAFRPALHDRGAKSALGMTFPAGGGEEEGRRLLTFLAHQPATAHHIATQLVEHFVSDRPDPQLVDRLAKVFLDSGGDLRAVTRALFTSDAFYAPQNRAAKLKTPFQLVASALRATTTRLGPTPVLLQTLKELGQVPYAESAPTGYPSLSPEWTSSGAMLSRMNFGLTLASGQLRGVTLDPALRPGTPVPELAARLLPGRDTRELVAAVGSDLKAQPDGTARGNRALGLILGSPAFQKH